MTGTYLTLKLSVNFGCSLLHFCVH